MEFIATILSPMYAQVFKKACLNSFFSRMKSAYYSSNFMESQEEVRIPTFRSMDQNRKFCHLWVIVDEGDWEEFKEKIEKKPPVFLEEVNDNLVAIAQKK